MKCLDLSEEEFYKLAEKHVVSPHEMPPIEELMGRTTNQKPWDYDQWSRVLDEGDDVASSGD